MNIVKIVRVTVIVSAFLIAGIAGSVQADSPETRPTSGPPETALAQITSKDADFAAAVSKAYAVIVIPKFSPSGDEPGKGEVLIDGKVAGRAMVQWSGLGVTDKTSYTEIVLVEDKKTLETISDAGLKFDDKVSATMLNTDVKTTAIYKQGIAVFVKNEGDQKTDRSVAGQQLAVKVEPK